MTGREGGRGEGQVGGREGGREGVEEGGRGEWEKEGRGEMSLPNFWWCQILGLWWYPFHVRPIEGSCKIHIVVCPLTTAAAPADLASMGTHPTLIYSLYHDIQKATLSVHLKQAFNLPVRRKNKPMDSYVALQLQQEVQESKVVRNSLNPMFEQEFEFSGRPSLPILKKQTLVFKVFGHNK